MSAGWMVTGANASVVMSPSRTRPAALEWGLSVHIGCRQIARRALPFSLLTLVLLALSGCGKVSDELVREPDALQKQLEGGLDSNSRTKVGDTLLIAAIRAQSGASLDLLLKAGADPSLAGADHHNAWYYALSNSDSEFLDSLMFAGRGPPSVADVDVLDVISSMEAHSALRTRLPLLLIAPVRIDVIDKEGRTPLSIVLNSNEPELADLLLNAGASGEGLSFETLTKLLEPGREGLLARVLSAGAQASTLRPVIDGQQPTDLIYAAIEQENIAAVQVLLEAGYEPPNSGADPMALAIVKGYPGVAVALLHRGANPDRQVDGLSAVDASELATDVSFMSELKLAPLDIDPDVARQTEFPLQKLGFATAAPDNAINLDGLKISIEAYQRKKGLAAHGHPSQLLAKVIDADLKGALLMAAAGGEMAKVASLYGNFTNIREAADRSGRDALMQASWHARPEVVRWLIANGHPMTGRDKGGSSALLLAVISPAPLNEAKQETIRALIAAGADVNAANGDGISPRKVALDRGGTLMYILAADEK